MSDWIAITGGCGYVGSHVAAAIKQSTNHNTLLIDNRAKKLGHTLAYGDRVVSDDYTSTAALRALDKLRPIAIVHCAASSLVGPSVVSPDEFYENNVMEFKVLLDHMRREGHDNLIFSSTSSVYGDGNGVAFKENDQLQPVSPYGKTKLVGELLLQDYALAYGLNSLVFRYFNAVGASPELGLGQEPDATHIIARLIEGLDRGEQFVINGNDYPTPDGTCIRDYVHVKDIARAHIMGIAWLVNNPGHHVYNIGSGMGHSVLEIVQAVEAVTKVKIAADIGRRRKGDPAYSLANTEKIAKDFIWQPLNRIEEIVTDANKWYNSDTFKQLDSRSI